jgi:hypothetical protein
LWNHENGNVLNHLTNREKEHLQQHRDKSIICIFFVYINVLNFDYINIFTKKFLDINLLYTL